MGTDTIQGGAGDDHIFGNAGDDTLNGDDGNDTISGGDGNDTVNGDDGDDTLSGDAGDDSISGGFGNDTISGGDGNDWITGNDGDDTANGDAGNDTLTGGDGTDTLNGGSGNDRLYGGGQPNDSLSGGGGDDQLDPGGDDFSGHELWVSLDWHRIIDPVATERNVVVTLTSPDGMSMSHVVDVMSLDEDHNVVFPLFESDTDYTLTVVVSDGLVGGGTVNFNSSTVIYVNGTHYESFEILCTGWNRLTTPGPDGSYYPPGYVPPTGGDTTQIDAVDDWGPYDQAGDPDPAIREYWTMEGAELDESAINGVLRDDVDSNGDPWTSFTASLAKDPLHGQVTLNSNGSFSYIPTAGFWGLDFFRYIVVGALGVSHMATVNIAVDTVAIKAQARGSWGWKIIGRTSGGQGTVPVPLPSAWVGQAVDLRVQPIGPVAATFDPNTQYAWTLQDKVIGGWTADTNASHFTSVDGQLNLDQPRVYWVSGGIKQVQVVVTPPAGAAVTVPGNIEIKRPDANATSVTTPVTAWNQGAGRAIKFGTRGNPDAGILDKDGITFTWHPDANAGGAYQWVQLIATNETRNYGGADEWWSTNGTVLDITPNTPLNNYWASRTSPFSDSPESGQVGLVHLNRSDTFRTYLMWKFNDKDFLGSIWVPICVTDWWWEGDASLSDGKWQLNNSPDDHSPNQSSSDTTNYPAWADNFLNAFKKQ